MTKIPKLRFRPGGLYRCISSTYDYIHGTELKSGEVVMFVEFMPTVEIKRQQKTYVGILLLPDGKTKFRFSVGSRIHESPEIFFKEAYDHDTA